MRNIFLLFFAMPAIIIAAPAQIKAPPLTPQQFAAAEGTTTKKVSDGAPREVMVITPLARAKDVKEAYQYIKTESASSPISITLKNGKILDNIIGINVMSEGTMVIFKLNTTKGVKLRIENIENILSLNAS
ncbi:MAG: hypothetical protein KAR79_03150 [Simkaniaceae bacterium]|nr:hypothetical protein [Simkaniaceae bacterium]